MQQAVIVSAVRTAIGKFGGSLAKIPAPELGALVIREAVARAGLKPEQVDSVIMGQVLTAGSGQNPARQATIKSGLPIETPAMTINVVCGSGLKSVMLAAQAVVFAVGAALGPARHPYGLLYRRFIAPRRGPVTKTEAVEQIRFAQLMGFIFCTVGVAGFVLKAPTVALIATGFALFAALMRAVFGICLPVARPGSRVLPEQVSHARPQRNCQHGELFGSRRDYSPEPS